MFGTLMSENVIIICASVCFCCTTHDCRPIPIFGVIDADVNQGVSLQINDIYS